MQHMTKLWSKTLFVVAVSVGVACPAYSQGLEAYALVHPFGLSSATTTRLFGMGAPIACVRDVGFANPAFAATQTTANFAYRLTSTDFDSGPELVSSHVHVVVPLRPNQCGLEINLLGLHTNSAVVNVAGIGPVVPELSEEDLSIQYGYRFSSRFTAGLGVSPASERRMRLTLVGVGPLLDVRAESDWGARAGVAYEWAPGSYLAAVYDYYQETVEGAGIALGGMARQAFHSELLAVGVSWQVDEKWLLAAEYQRARTHAGATEAALYGWHFGAEMKATPRVSLRVGANDEELSAGIGYEGKRCQVQYAYVNDWNDDAASALLGGSDTHQLQVIFSW